MAGSRCASRGGNAVDRETLLAVLADLYGVPVRMFGGFPLETLDAAYVAMWARGIPSVGEIDAARRRLVAEHQAER